MMSVVMTKICTYYFEVLSFLSHFTNCVINTITDNNSMILKMKVSVSMDWFSVKTCAKVAVRSVV